ncbi:hypothetical protein L484_025350 [Morus notabilis]|uniref:Non-haem dioxygenase N-terminal domain-containing protein n=1 Tax=Morus notabilis TaxID=981085 RepID=W9R251_9ROSA|nr:hypothetical protein L484_025350 [Morus notabilis]
MDPTSIEDGVKLDEGLGWGKSLPVPSVQEMVRNDVEYVPERFIQDFEDNKRELNKLYFACKEWSFFQIINNGIAAEVLSNVETALASFFYIDVGE